MVYRGDEILPRSWKPSLLNGGEVNSVVFDKLAIQLSWLTCYWKYTKLNISVFIQGSSDNAESWPIRPYIFNQCQVTLSMVYINYHALFIWKLSKGTFIYGQYIWSWKIGRLFYQRGLTLIPAWISNHAPSKIWITQSSTVATLKFGNG